MSAKPVGAERPAVIDGDMDQPGCAQHPQPPLHGGADACEVSSDAQRRECVLVPFRKRVHTAHDPDDVSLPTGPRESRAACSCGDEIPGACGTTALRQQPNNIHGVSLVSMRYVRRRDKRYVDTRCVGETPDRRRTCGRVPLRASVGGVFEHSHSRRRCVGAALIDVGRAAVSHVVPAWAGVFEHSHPRRRRVGAAPDRRRTCGSVPLRACVGGSVRTFPLKAPARGSERRRGRAGRAPVSGGAGRRTPSG